MGTFLVTGGAGFIGSHVVDELLAEGHAVRVVDSLDPAAHDGPPGYLDGRADLAIADLVDTPAWSGLLEGVDGVCHQAAKVGMGQDFANVLALTAREPVPGAFNVASGDPRTIAAMASTLAAAFDGSGRRRSPASTGWATSRHVFASAERAAAVLGFRARVPFEAGLRAFASVPLRRPAALAVPR